MTGRQEDLEAALRAIRGHPDDEAAWRVVYLAYRKQVLGQLYMLGFHAATDREDLTGEVFFRFIAYSPWSRDWSNLPDPAVIAAYLRRTAQNVAFTAVRNRENKRLAQDDLLEYFAQSALLDRVGDDLTREEKSFIVAYVEAGFSLQALASALGITYTAAGTRLHRIRKKIRAAIRSR